MRIPLDYYRILSVPVKATSEQLEQAYSDRLQQQPRHEYSERALEARRKLIVSAYQVLSDIEQRANYDARFLVNMQPIEASESSDDNDTKTPATDVTQDVGGVSLANSTIEIPSAQLLGALLILHELGEYETVLKIGIEYFNYKLEETQTAAATIDSTRQDLILAIALAYLELGREQWQRHEYENAAVSGEMGIDLLDRQSLFPELREELELDLHKLRPYQVLELISQNPTESPERTKGFQLLRSMLIQRQGIEGNSDPSGLNFERFLGFIQQLRTFLTSAEQQQLFDNESQQDSAIANYLAVYALFGRGFSLKQPELIIRAQRKLDSLSEKQDVSWEQTVAALLLGHTEKAINKLQHAPDTSKLEMVRQYGANNSDLLPGLCFYSEQWLLKEVVTQFEDLSGTRVTLKEYFADRQVQACLDELAPPKIDAVSTSDRKAVQHSLHQDRTKIKVRGFWHKCLNLFSSEAASAKVKNTAKVPRAERELVRIANSGNLSQNVSSSATTTGGDRSSHSAHKQRVYRTTIVPSSNLHQHQQHIRTSPSLPLQPKAKTRAVPSEVIEKAQKAKRKRLSKRKRGKATLLQGWLFIFGLILGVGSLGYIATKLFLFPSPQNVNRAQLAIAISQPAVEIPPKETKPVVARSITFTETARETIQSWLDSKSAAFGKEYQIEQLNSILTEPLLTTWRDRALAYQRGQFYREYEHQLKVRSAKIDPQNPNKATIEAEVKEAAQHYQSGQLDEAQSYDDNLLVRYQLVRQEDKWLLQATEVLKTLE